LSYDGTPFETKLIVLLGDLLSGELKLRAVSESIYQKDRPDIIVYVNGVKVVLEGSYTRKDAEKDVKHRIEEGLGDLGVALYYRERFPSNIPDSELRGRLRESTFEVRLVVPEDISETLLVYFTNKNIEPKWVTGWMEARIVDLVFILNDAIQFIVNEKDIAETVNRIEQNINDFVGSIRSLDQKKKVAERLYDDFYRLNGLSVDDYKKIDDLIYANAALTILLSTTFYQSIHAQIGLSGMNQLCEEHGLNDGLRRGFKEILNIDYKPIYNLAIQVIDVLPPALTSALEKVVNLASECASKRTLLKKDFSGKIYHKIVGNWAIRKNFATYFTTVQAAYLFAYLAVFTRTGVFREFNDSIKVGDLACGSGTLLTSAYNALKDLYMNSKLYSDRIDLKSFHKKMLEEGIWGIDALRYAVQIAATNLVLQDPTTQISRMRTFTIPLGKEDDHVTLGSLDFVIGEPDVQRTLPSIARYFEEGPTKFMEAAEDASILRDNNVPEKIPLFDLIVMNPPFTRATGRGGREGGGLFGFILDESVRKDI
jgi:hypothetical protein